MTSPRSRPRWREAAWALTELAVVALAIGLSRGWAWAVGVVFLIGGLRFIDRKATPQRDSLPTSKAVSREARHTDALCERWRPIAYGPQVMPAREPGIRIEERGREAWAVVDGPLVLGKSGAWEMEPQPSERSAAFISRTRWSTAAEAARAFSVLTPDEPGA